MIYINDDFMLAKPIHPYEDSQSITRYYDSQFHRYDTSSFATSQSDASGSGRPAFVSINLDLYQYPAARYYLYGFGKEGGGSGEGRSFDFYKKFDLKEYQSVFDVFGSYYI